jgi:hypothetical protein
MLPPQTTSLLPLMRPSLADDGSFDPATTTDDFSTPIDAAFPAEESPIDAETTTNNFGFFPNTTAPAFVFPVLDTTSGADGGVNGAKATGSPESELDNGSGVNEPFQTWL